MLGTLSQEQFSYVVKYWDCDDENQIGETSLRALDIKFFDTTFMTGFKPVQKTLGEYFDQTKKIRAVLNEADFYCPIAKRFSLRTYSLAHWFDPNMESTDADVQTMWISEVDFSPGLIPAPWLDEMSKSESPSPFNEGIGDKRRRKTPQRPFDSLPLTKGIDGTYFLCPTADDGQPNETQARIIFDLQLPLEFQLAQAKAMLEQQQDALVQGGFVQKLRKQTDRFGSFAEYLEILDLLSEGATHLDIAKTLEGLTEANEWRRDPKANKLVQVTKIVGRSKRVAPVNELTQNTRKKIERAIQLRDHGYRALAFSA